jgi:hypothetical protein
MLGMLAKWRFVACVDVKDRINDTDRSGVANALFVTFNGRFPS